MYGPAAGVGTTHLAVEGPFESDSCIMGDDNTNISNGAHRWSREQRQYNYPGDRRLGRRAHFGSAGSGVLIHGGLSLLLRFGRKIT